MAFLSNGRDVKDLFMTRTDLIQRFTGKKMYGVGYNGGGILGNNSVVAISNPVILSPTLRWTTIATSPDNGGGSDNSSRNSGGITSDGKLYLWGTNLYGQLGQNNIVHSSVPIQVGSETNWRSLAIGSNVVAAVKQNGTLWTAGEGLGGKLGLNDIANRSVLTQVGTDTDWASVSAGSQFVLALKRGGQLYGWGLNTSGQLADQTTINRSSPIAIAGANLWKQVAAGWSHVVAIADFDKMWAWGLNSSYQLGDGTNISRSSPVMISANYNWRSIAAGAYNSAGITTDGQLWLCGNNSAAQIGNNSTATASYLVQTVHGGNNWKQVSLGQYHTVAVKQDGTLWTWGYNVNGQLGDNTTVSKGTPVQIGKGNDFWVDVKTAYLTTFATTI